MLVLCNALLKAGDTFAASIFRIPQRLLLHEARAWLDVEYGRAFTHLKVGYIALL